MQEHGKTLADIIASRRTLNPQFMNGNLIPEEEIDFMLRLADYAPTHGRTEPWRFYVFGPEKKAEFCQAHADMKRAATPDLPEDTYQKLLHMGDKASHIVALVMRRGDLPKIPELEEILAVGAAVQNVLLLAESKGIAAYWGTGGSTLQPEMKNFLRLREEDKVVGLLYLGYTSEPAKPAKRNLPADAKIIRM